MSFIQELNQEKLEAFARVHAHLCGDGCICSYKTTEKDRINRVEIIYCNNNLELIASFKEDMSLLFNVKMSYKPKLKQIRVKSIKIANILFGFGKYGTRSWRIPEIIQNSNRLIKLEWINAYCLDEGYVPPNKKIIRVKSMNYFGLFQMKELVNFLEINSSLTGPNCDNSYYLTIRKEKELQDFYKKPSRKYSGGKTFTR
jgi:hypothetical protein